MRADKRGFTLLETVIAISILAAVAGILAVAFRLAQASIERGESHTQATARLRAAIGIMERTIRSADPAQVASGDNAGPYFVGEPKRLRFLSASAVSAASGAGFRLVCFREAEGEEGGGLAVAEGSPFRAEGADTWEGTQDTRVFLPGASEVAFTYSAGPDEAGTWEWVDTWDAVERDGLPRAVRVEFVVTGEDGRQETTAFAVPIFAGT